MKTRNFRDLQVWQRSMQLARDVYRITASFPRSETFGLTGQMRRAAVSVPSNIAEGQGRLTDKAFAAFLGQARGSLYELQTQLELAESLDYLAGDTLETILDDAVAVAQMLNGLLNKMKPSENRRTLQGGPGKASDA